METNTEPGRPSLFKQLLGAAGGAVVALLLYQAYKISVPVVTAWIVVPQSQIAAEHPGSVRVNQEVSEYELNRLAAKAKEIYQRFAAEPGPQAAISRQGIEVTQPLPASSSFIARVDLKDLMAQSSVSSSSVASSASSSSSLASAPAEPVVPDAASSARARAEQLQAKLAGEKLPSSGIGTALAAALAFGTATILRKRWGSR